MTLWGPTICPASKSIGMDRVEPIRASAGSLTVVPDPPALNKKPGSDIVDTGAETSPWKAVMGARGMMTACSQHDLRNLGATASLQFDLAPKAHELIAQEISYRR